MTAMSKKVNAKKIRKRRKKNAKVKMDDLCEGEPNEYGFAQNWRQLPSPSSSESEYSDSETNQAEQLK